MEEAVLVHVSETEQDLEHDALDFLLGEWLIPVFHELVDVLFHIFKYEVQVVVHTDNFLQFDDVAVV